jgi:hypothetical protein
MSPVFVVAQHGFIYATLRLFLDAIATRRPVTVRKKISASVESLPDHRTKPIKG